MFKSTRKMHHFNSSFSNKKHCSINILSSQSRWYPLQLTRHQPQHFNCTARIQGIHSQSLQKEHIFCILKTQIAILRTRLDSLSNQCTKVKTRLHQAQTACIRVYLKLLAKVPSECRYFYHQYFP